MTEVGCFISLEIKGKQKQNEALSIMGEQILDNNDITTP